MKFQWWPRSLMGQLLALLLGGLVASHAIGLWMLSSDHGDIHPLAHKKATDMFVRLFKAVEPLDSVAAASVLSGASDERASFVLISAPGAVALGEDSMAAKAFLHVLLDRPATPASACIGEDCILAQAAPQSSRLLTPLVLQAQRADGRWMQATLWTEVRTRWWWPVSFWLQVSLIPIFFAVAVAVRSVARPGRALVAAAGRVSRGERVESLRIEGPSEMREILLAFNQMQTRLARFIDDRTRMLAAISHDFRTPITSLRLRAELLDDEALRLPMVRTLNDMRAMVDETLRFARDDASQEASDDVDLCGLLDEVIADQKSLGRDVRWAEDPVTLAPYRCRPLALKRAFANLVDNAIRYGDRARVRLSLKDEDAALQVDVDDDGPGIAPEWMDAAFTPFARVQQGTQAQRTGGAGLGLSIARSCLRAHGGDVQFLPQAEGPGGRARVTLPL